MYLHYGKVINCVQANTRYGKRLALNIKLEDGEKVACWSDVLDNKSFLSLKSGDSVRLIKSPKGSYTLVEDETSNGSNGSNGSNRSNGSDSSNTLSTQTYSQPDRNGHSSPSNHQENILDLPFLSDADKRNMMIYIKSQSKLLKFCYDVCAEQFPEMKGKDERGLRSLAISLLISANQARDRYKV